MKKLLLSILLVSAFLGGKSQSLLNTTWLGTNPPSPNLWFQFRTDTLFYSFGSGGYTALSLYTASGGQFTVFDLPGTTLCTDTGHYSYSIVGSNLLFTLVSDNCSSRRNTMLNYNWFLLSTSVAELDHPSGVVAYPNPATDGIFTLSVPNFIPGKTEVLLYDITGKLVLREKLEATETCFDIHFLPQGIYTGTVRSDKGSMPFRIVR